MTIKWPHREGNRNSKGEKLLDMCNRNVWMISNKLFQKKRSHNITHYSWNGSVGTIIDYFTLTRILWNILNHVKVIPNKSLEGDHRILITDFRMVAKQRPIVYQEKKN
jgi:hypothetical protein